MTTRHLIAYVLIAVLVVGIGWALWAATYGSKRSARRRRRRERQARHQANKLEERPE
jgi:Tfp pilus assembly protein PilO